MAKKKEEHRKHFRGCWISPEVMEMIESKIISTKEAILLMIIDSLCEHGGRDCWASNEYLGKRIGSQKSQITGMIAHLKELGMITQTRFDGRFRYLASNPSAYRKIGRQPTEKRVGEESPKGTIRDTAPPEGGAKRNSPVSRNGKSLHPRWRTFAASLAEAISRVRKISHKTKLGTWATAFYRLHSVDEVPILEIRRVLKWYCTQIQEGDLIRENNFIPVAYSGAAFREKFLRIQDAIGRKQPRDKQGEKHPVVTSREATPEEYKRWAEENPDLAEILERTENI